MAQRINNKKHSAIREYFFLLKKHHQKVLCYSLKQDSDTGTKTPKS